MGRQSGRHVFCSHTHAHTPYTLRTYTDAHTSLDSHVIRFVCVAPADPIINGRSNSAFRIFFGVPGTRVPQTQTLAAAAMRAPTALLLALLCAIAAPLCAAQVSVIELSQLDQGSRCEAFSAANVNCQGVVPVGTLVYLNSSTTQASADAFATTQASTRPTPSIELFVLRAGLLSPALDLCPLLALI